MPNKIEPGIKETVVWNGAIMVRESYPSGSYKVDGETKIKYGFKLRAATPEEAAAFHAKPESIV